MQQTLFAREEFNKRTIRHHGFYLGFVNRSHFRYGNNSFDPGHSFIQAFFGRTEDAYFTLVTDFLEVDGSTGFSLYLLYNFSTWPDNRTDEFFVNK